MPWGPRKVDKVLDLGETAVALGIYAEPRVLRRRSCLSAEVDTLCRRSHCPVRRRMPAGAQRGAAAAELGTADRIVTHGDASTTVARDAVELSVIPSDSNHSFLCRGRLGGSASRAR